jgi:hypothetical protein
VTSIPMTTTMADRARRGLEEVVSRFVFGALGSTYALTGTSYGKFPSLGIPDNPGGQLGFVADTTLYVARLVIPEILVAAADATGPVMFRLKETTPATNRVVLEVACPANRETLNMKGSGEAQVTVVAGTTYVWNVEMKIPAGTATFSMANDPVSDPLIAEAVRNAA